MYTKLNPDSWDYMCLVVISLDKMSYAVYIALVMSYAVYIAMAYFDVSTTSLPIALQGNYE